MPERCFTKQCQGGWACKPNKATPPACTVCCLSVKPYGVALARVTP
ncbi:MAG: hypothetical protein JWR60_2500 [Polaromonas sp.]|nr:hypothetical protein [Polaromonas sp.]